MDEEQILKYILNISGQNLGIASVAASAFYLVWKRIGIIQKIITDIWNESTFNKYNVKLGLIQESKTTYKFFHTIFKSNSDEIFQTLKSIYDFTSIKNIRAKTINFRMEELQDNSNLQSNIIRFLDYYKTKNGVRINIFLHSTDSIENTSSNIKATLKKYIEDSKIHSVKIISDRRAE